MGHLTGYLGAVLMATPQYGNLLINRYLPLSIARLIRMGPLSTNFHTFQLLYAIFRQFFRP